MLQGAATLPTNAAEPIAAVTRLPTPIAATLPATRGTANPSGPAWAFAPAITSATIASALTTSIAAAIAAALTATFAAAITAAVATAITTATVASTCSAAIAASHPSSVLPSGDPRRFPAGASATSDVATT